MRASRVRNDAPQKSPCCWGRFDVNDSLLQAGRVDTMDAADRFRAGVPRDLAFQTGCSELNREFCEPDAAVGPP